MMMFDKLETSKDADVVPDPLLLVLSDTFCDPSDVAYLLIATN